MSAQPTDDPHAAGELLHAGEPLSSARGAVILLHGRGGSAEDILSLAQPLQQPGLVYVAPQASGNT